MSEGTVEIFRATVVGWPKDGDGEIYLDGYSTLLSTAVNDGIGRLRDKDHVESDTVRLDGVRRFVLDEEWVMDQDEMGLREIVEVATVLGWPVMEEGAWG